MELNKLTNANGVNNSLQVSRMGAITAGVFKLPTGQPFLIKNITEDNITMSVKLANMSDFIDTIIYPGWNPELIVEVQNAAEGQLQYGY